ncbi:hypothetical protein L596_014536 [Steinernema carpocapsae]|uniref:UBX domain-containing protein n=1 Tax=Steinernema carpocapsae TaxID=34508 RepID=A0A4U5NCA0_STECR|nr:hypothetical protein L596_014536 [Steinernema carpocapsae]
MDSNEISDEKVEQFLGITGCTKASEAKHYLEACGNDMTKALNLYFAQQSRATARDNSNSLRPMPANGGPSTSKASASGNGDMDGDNVRAPIAPVSGPIVEQSFQQTYRNRHPHMASTVFNHFADYRNEAEMQFRNFQQLRERLEAEMAEEAEFGGSSSASADDRQRLLEEKERSLRGIFQPPYDLMYSGDWELARMEAEERGYWLLVNIQDPHEFSSQVLNRDVWSNPAVKDVIKSNFLFWQVYHQSADGTRIAAYYKIVKFPAILIIDPRTGEMVKTLRVAEPVSFSDELTTFLEKFPDFASHDSKQIGFGDAQKKANGAEKSNGADESSNIEKSSSTEKPKIEDKSNGTDRKSRKRVIETVLLDSDDEMDVDMPGPSSRIIKPKRTKVEKDVEDIADRIKNGHKITTGDQEAWKKLIGPVSADTKDIAVVMRMPNGDRHNISVPDSTSLNALFAFISGIGYESSDHLLVLLYPKREYDVDSASITLREMNFSRRELVYVEKKYV